MSLKVIEITSVPVWDMLSPESKKYFYIICNVAKEDLRGELEKYGIDEDVVLSELGNLGMVSVMPFVDEQDESANMNGNSRRIR